MGRFPILPAFIFAGGDGGIEKWVFRTSGGVAGILRSVAVRDKCNRRRHRDERRASSD
ncbi:hypothetical protein LguiA_034919 [Lonicera macranthoides]